MSGLLKVLVCSVLILCITGMAAADTFIIQPTSLQDGPVYGNNDAEEDFPYGWFGQYNLTDISMVSIHTLPAISSGEVVSATLEIPQPDILWTADQTVLGFNIRIKHINAINDTTISAGDRTTAALGDIGQLRASGPLATNKQRIVSFDVTAFVKNDLDAHRVTFAWRTQVATLSTNSIGSYMYMPTVDNGDTTFPLRGARLTIEVERPQWRHADINNDIKVDMKDIAVLGQWWGWQYGEPKPESTPPQSDWRWEKAESYAPSPGLFENRGTATVEFGAQYAAPGAPADVAHLYGVIKYRDNVDCFRNYDVFFSPTLVIWKLWRYETTDEAEPEITVGRASFAFKTKTDPLSNPAHILDYFMFPTVENTQGFPQAGAKLTLEVMSPAQTFVIRPTGNQDAAVYFGVVDITSPYGFFGLYTGNQIGTVSIFTLPVGVTADRVVSAALTVPQPDYVMQNANTGYPEGYNFNLVHIDATDDTTVSRTDLSAERELGVIGIFRAAGPVSQNIQRIMSYDVTAQVKADMNAVDEIHHATHAQYIGGFHFANCFDGRDGEVTAMDRCFMPAIGLHPNWMVEPGNGATENLGVRTNSGCGQYYPTSSPWPINNYQGSGSASGEIPPIISIPMWTPATQTLHSVSNSLPWIHYPGVLDPLNYRFIEDFTSYDAAAKTLIQEQIAEAENNIQLENQMRILPDGTIMWTITWTDIKGGPWVTYATDGFWLTPDTAPNGQVWYYDTTTSNYVNPFAVNHDATSVIADWVGYFIDPIRPAFGIGFYFDKTAGTISCSPADNWPNSPSVLHPDYMTNVQNFGVAFRQMFMVIGTKEEM